MTKSPEICSVCAWRDTCKKRKRMLGPLPMCGHYAFPRPLEDVCRAIGAQRCPDFVEDVSFEKESDEQEEKAEGED
ncbi:MAG: hypothetical protein P8Y85_07050 [Nitrospirota bacterium]